MDRLIVLLGPTGVGKTDLSLDIAESLSIPIISADSRQIYRDMPIGTAAPTIDEQKRVKHYFIANKDINETYSAGQFEIDVIDLLNELFKVSDNALMTGGSMMYIDAVCNGMDDIPDVDPQCRADVARILEEEGLEKLQAMLKLMDPVHYAKVDLKNHRRVFHAVEICLQTGRPYSDILTSPKKQRPFDIIKIGLNRPTEELYERINLRVDQMVINGLEEEARRLYPHKNLNALNTVGYKEWFDFFDGKIESREKAIELIKRNSRRYAKKQLSWFRRDKNIAWFHPNEKEQILNYLRPKSAGISPQ